MSDDRRLASRCLVLQADQRALIAFAERAARCGHRRKVAHHFAPVRVEQADGGLGVAIGYRIFNAVGKGAHSPRAVYVGEDRTLLDDLAPLLGNRFVVGSELDEPEHDQVRDECEKPCEEGDPQRCWKPAQAASI